ncbi:MAG: hypothetical protein AAGH40_00735 [Verrucomicrobiota bacterium]
MRLRFILSALASILAAVLIADASVPYRELSSPDGKTIMARPVGVYGDQVNIEINDGRKLNVSVDFFTAEDAKFLKDWALEYLNSKNQLLEYDVKRKEDKTQDYKKDVRLTSGGVAKDALEIEEYDGYYEITLRNRSDFEIDLVRVEYRIFSEQENTAKEDRHDVRYKRKSGILKYANLNPRDSMTNKTGIVKLVETKLGKGIRWSSGGDLQSKAKMIGVWFRVYYGETMIHEYAQPTVLPKREEW